MNKKKILLILLIGAYLYYNYIYNPYVYITRTGDKYHTTNSPYYQQHPDEYIKIRLKDAQKLHYEPCSKN